MLQIRTVGAVALAASLAVLAWGLHAYGIFVSPLSAVPMPLSWIVVVGCGILLPAQLWNRTGSAEIVSGDAGQSILRLRGPSHSVRELALSEFQGVEGDDRLGRVRIEWAKSGARPMDLFCRDAEAFANQIRRAGVPPTAAT